MISLACSDFQPHSSVLLLVAKRLTKRDGIEVLVVDFSSFKFFFLKRGSKVNFIDKINRQDTPRGGHLIRVPKSTELRTLMSLHRS